MPTIRGSIITRNAAAIFEATSKVDKETGRIQTRSIKNPGLRVARESEDSFIFVLVESNSDILNRKIIALQKEFGTENVVFEEA